MKIALAFRSSDKAIPYRRALAEAGLESVAFTPAEPGSLENAGGLVLTGGSDVDAALYGAGRDPNCGETDRARDDYESTLLREALNRDLPVLAICRGMQLFNVVRGGTLIQHLATADAHRPHPGETRVHKVTLAGPLADLFGAAGISVNSRHHQAVDRLADGAIVTATSPEDGVIEGLALPSARFALAVQWHPEDMTGDYPEQRALFRAFSEAVR